MTVSAVEEAKGKREAVAEVATKELAVGVVVATTRPFAFVERSPFWIAEIAKFVVVAFVRMVFVPVALTHVRLVVEAVTAEMKLVVAYVLVRSEMVEEEIVRAPGMERVPFSVVSPETVRAPVIVVVDSELCELAENAVAWMPPPKVEVAPPVTVREVAETLVPEILPPVMVESLSAILSSSSIRRAPPTAL